MKALVIGGTGTVGSRVAQEMRRRGHEVRVMTHSPEKAERLPDGVEGVVGDLEDPASLAGVFEGVDGVFMATPLAMDETELGLNGVRAAKEAGIRRMVYQSVHRIEDAPHIPHFQTKLPIQHALAESGMEWTLIQPNNFYQNDHWFQEPITRLGLYPQPIGDVGLNRVDARDIADAAVNALTRDGHAGKAFPLVGPDALTGEDVAGLWSEALGREVRYAGNNLDAWAAQARFTMPAWLVHDLRLMYQYFQEEGLLATEEEFDRQAQVLEHPPRRFADFAAETAAAWNA